MSETAQEQTTIAPTAEEMAAADAAAAAAAAEAAAPAGKTNSRSYTLFEETRTDTWTRLQAVEAATEEDALGTLYVVPVV